jgi:Family of unknown function (DUF6111)
MMALVAILEVLVPLLLPFLIYVLVMRWRAGRPLPAWLADGSWLWYWAAGLALMVAGLAVWAVFGTHEPGAAYTPARLENGRLVPGRLEEGPRR